ncbi:Serine-type D-Ala-D-Ala carboxypeptidase [Alkaliphilus metalliredigens QYMF]|uniref:serine-type D-Ala-D-Ala carboxypeptidase n=1 Tax=Alkaliphilus metalliredigens (strain QYMF) TaxID=293826 RepID=A6TR63_ALKMQ|nr:D-alanyl-D-alanine carboxypeptidase family protein [Alkaliphilus metalliredigens]ABR48681.1 Serine-type D-Ala-D-Ala carboxypeptidase [Alkaliphilus metalliredigens QYMF]
MQRKKFLKLMSGCLILMTVLALNTTTLLAQPFELQSKAGILIDAATGEVLYEKNIHESLPPASVTKIMTMLLTMEALDTNRITLNDKVVVSERASSMGGTQLYLEPGEVKTVEELMKGIAIRSANDACVAIGEHISGSEDAFVQKMNERAKELGMKNTTFINTNGLPAEGHVTSVYDIALMSKELLKYPDVQKWLTTWMDTVVVGKRESTQELVNTNRLIRTYKGATGLKTGFTQAALHCLSASATRGNNTFIAVVLAAPTSQVRFSEAAQLLDFGFANYNTIEIAERDVFIGNINIQKGQESIVRGVAKEDLKVLVKKGEEDQVQKEVILPQFANAPVLKGDKMGEVIATINGKEVGRVDIISESDIEKANVVNMFTKMIRSVVGE